MRFIRAKGVGRHVQVKFKSRELAAKRDKALFDLGFASYRDYLRSDLWKAIRAAVLETTPKCELCDSKAQHVHHLRYTRQSLTARARWALVAICAECHRKVEFDEDGRKRHFAAVYKQTKILMKLAGKWDDHKRQRAKGSRQGITGDVHSG